MAGCASTYGNSSGALGESSDSGAGMQDKNPSLHPVPGDMYFGG